MSLTAADVAEIMRLVEQSGFDELTLEMEGTKISLRRGVGTATPPAAVAAGSPAAAVTAPAKPVPVAAPAAATVDPGLQDLPSPLLGTFYRSPKPGAPPFVEVGTEVQEDTIIGIIEVMKLMNTVRAGVRGTVAEILVADGTLAEFGEILMRVRKSG
ncbi:MAG TPA: acetyl-CoA carboxylase biotin carboxyl carrier protein [Steroidobacteraceae bacterium]|nr:acetyl-CoA carboxylase biotin carboxyl carrier protein [Steroidobacteraceae bacterium]